MNPKQNEKINPVILVITLITLFVFITSFTVFYTEENFSSACGCKLPIWVIITSISSFGLFVGSLIFYLLNQNISSERKNTKKVLELFLNFLENEEKEVMKFIIKNSGKTYQNKIAKELKFDKVKVSRIINNLEKKNIINRKKEGMTNIVFLQEEIKDVFE